MHTKGPWHFDGHGINSTEGERIAKVLRNPDGTNWPDDEGYIRFEADSRLIAAAPELLEALSDLLSLINLDKDGDYFICKESKPKVDTAYAVLAELEGT